MAKRNLWIPGLLAGIVSSAWIAGLVRSFRLRMDFRGKAVVITGGSRGLGLVLARMFAREGAMLALLARDSDELLRAQQELKQKGARVLAIPCDITQPGQVDSAVMQILESYGRIDVLINNAGIVQVGPMDHMGLEDFEEAMEVHFWGPLYTILAVRPTMQRQGGGRIINIASIGGQIPVPHMAPYTASKYALVGLSDALRAELASEGIAVSTICPGLMRTGSHWHGLYKGQHEKEFAWFSIVDASLVASTRTETAARQILSAARYATPKRTLTWQARLAALFEEIFPNLFAYLNNLIARSMPGSNPLAEKDAWTGFESRSRWVPSWLTRLADRAAAKNNELPPGWRPWHEPEEEDVMRTGVEGIGVPVTGRSYPPNPPAVR